MSKRFRVGNFLEFDLERGEGGNPNQILYTHSKMFKNLDRK
ncbi:hypothetical protein [Leptospira johnsonii]|nr:hypothetical protein [Leptospira johnsonii]